MSFLFSNNAESRLTTPLTGVGVTLQVMVGHGVKFNQAVTPVNPERVTITDGIHFEMVDVTAWSGDVATVVRGAEGTTPIAWAAGVDISSRLTAGIMSSLKQNIMAEITNAFILDTTTLTYDLMAIFGSLAAIPQHIMMPPGGLSTRVVNVALPPTVGLNTVVHLDIIKPTAGVATVNANVPSGDYMDGTLNSLANVHNSQHLVVVGHNGVWFSGYI